MWHPQFGLGSGNLASANLSRQGACNALPGHLRRESDGTLNVGNWNVNCQTVPQTGSHAYWQIRYDTLFPISGAKTTARGFVAWQRLLLIEGYPQKAIAGSTHVRVIPATGGDSSLL